MDVFSIKKKRDQVVEFESWTVGLKSLKSILRLGLFVLYQSVAALILRCMRIVLILYSDK